MNEVKDSAEFYRNLWAGAEARLAESQAEVARLRAALVELLAEAEDGIATCPLTRAAARAALEPTR